MLPQQALDHLQKLIKDLTEACSACLHSGVGWTSILFILTASEIVALYSAGSRRTSKDRGSRALQDFLTRGFPRFNSSARDPYGHYYRVRIPLLREQGKASRRLKIPAALVYLFRRGVVEELAAPMDAPSDLCVIVGQGRWGFLINPNLFYQDFRESLEEFLQQVQLDKACAARYLKRFRHLHG
ncbi:MAG: hypothetical protein ACUVS3_14515 [Thermodesulfobacteriota bacterium]